MKILINYANDAYRNTQKFNSWTGRHIAGFDKIYEFGPDDIEESYRRRHEDIFSYKRGDGLWLWKPYLILRVLESCNEGDIIFYADSGSFFLKKIDPVIESLNKNESVWVSDIPLLEQCFTKPECFQALRMDKNKFGETNQIQATFFMAVCNLQSKEIVKQWLELCQNKSLISPKGSMELDGPVHSDFVMHREDQSLLSLLCKKNNILPHKDPSQRGTLQGSYYSPNYTFKPTRHTDNYKNVIFLHKLKKVKVKALLKILIKACINNIRSKKTSNL